VEDGLARAGADVDHDAVVLQADGPSRIGHELEHPLGLVGRKVAYVAERLDVALREHEEVRVGPRVDVADRDEAVRGMHVVSFADELAEEAVVGHAATIPSSTTAWPRTCTSSPTGAAGPTSHGE
jgi:hypothetical protein